MNLDDVTHIDETDTHFIAHHAGGPFRIAKDELDDDVADSIRSIAKGKAAAHEALGNGPGPDGVVRADKGAALPDTTTWPDDLSGFEGTVLTAPAAPADPAAILAAAGVPNVPGSGDAAMATPGFPGGVAAPHPSSEDVFSEPVGDAPVNVGALAQQAGPAQFGQMPQPDAGVPWGSLVSTPADRVVASSPEEQAQIDRETARLAGMQTSARGASSASAVTSLSLPGVGGNIPPFHPTPFDGSALDAATQDAIAGERARAAAIADASKEEAAIQEASSARFKQLTDDYNGRIANHQKKIDATVSWLEHNEIDPRRLFHQQSTAGAIGSGIALFVSGFGSGLSHQSNAALDLMNKAVNDDVDAQKANRENRQTLLGTYLSEGRRLEDAARLAKADELTHTAGLLSAAATKWGGPLAIAEAQKAVGALKAKAFQEKVAAETNDFQMKHLAYATDIQRRVANLQMTKERLSIAAMQKTLAASPALKHPVRLPSGQWVEGGDTAKDAKGELQAIQDARAVLERGAKLGPTLGVLTSGTRKETSDKAQLLAALEKVQTKGVRNKVLLEAIKEGEVPNFGAWVGTNKDAQIAELQSMLGERENSIVNDLTQGPMQTTITERAAGQ